METLVKGGAAAIRWLRWLPCLALLPCAIMVARPATALESDERMREAAKHFQRGVTLYNEADYRSALVEFRRASELVPSPAALYNIGEAEYQLQDYAGALTDFERYLAVATPEEHHWAEVRANVEVLRTRVGHLFITTTPTGADVTIDDQPVGKTPLEKALRVSIGRRKVTASIAGRMPVQRYVDVAADDNVTLTLWLAPPPTDGATATTTARSSSSSGPSGGEDRSTHGSWLHVMGWIATGTLTAGAVTFALLANAESNELKRERATYPVSRDTLNHTANTATVYAITADTFAAAALIVGGITLFSTLSSPSGSRVQLGLSSVHFETTF